MPDGLDVTASRTGDTVYLHVVNTQRTRSVAAQLGVAGRTDPIGNRVRDIAADPEIEVLPDNADVLAPVRTDLPDERTVDLSRRLCLGGRVDLASQTA